MAPVKVQINEPVKQIKVAGDRNFAVTNSGSLIAFGSNHDFQLGIDENTPNFPKNTPHMIKNPLKVTVPAPVDQIWTGRSTTIVLCQDGKLYCFGSNKAKVLVDEKYSYLPTPDEITKLESFGEIKKFAISQSIGNSMVVAHTSDNKTIAWGNDETALDDFDDIVEPITVSALNGKEVVDSIVFLGEGYVIVKN